jgi:hypothetical protein
MRWLERSIVEGTPTLTTFARMTNTLAELDRAEAGWRNPAMYPRV